MKKRLLTMLGVVLGLSYLCGADTVAQFTRATSSGYINTGARVTSTPFTVEMWVNPTTIESGDNVVFAQDVGGDAGRFNIVPRGDGTLFVQIGANAFSPKCPLPVGVWTHLAFSRTSDGGVCLYTNGLCVATNTFNTLALSAADIVLGRQHRNAGNGFNGRMSDVRVWNTCRTQAEINNLMRRRLAGNEAGLISYFRLDEGGVNAPHDAVRNADGAFGSGAAWVEDATVARRGGPTDNTALVFARSTSGSSTCVTTTNRITTVPLSVELWIKPRAIASKDNLLLSQDVNGDAGRFNFLLRGSNTILAHIGGDHFFQVTYPVPTNVWTHLAYTRTGAGLGTIYVNGDILATQDMGTNRLTATDIVIGLQKRSPANGFDGQISEVRVWNRCRQREEIVADLNRRLTGRETGLICLYALNDNFGAAYARDAVTEACAPITSFQGWRDTVNLPMADDLPSVLRFARAPSEWSSAVMPTNRIATVAFTIEGWVKPERLESGDNYLFTQDIGGDAGRLIISQVNGTKYYFQVGENRLQPSASLPTNVWTHLAFVRDDDGVASIYTNGLLLATATLNKNIPSAADFRIGRLDRTPYEAYGFIGLMSDVRVWSVAKSQSEIAAGKNVRVAGDETDLQFAFDLDDRSGVARDKVSSAEAEVVFSGVPELATGLPTAADGEYKLKFKRARTSRIDAGVGISSDLFTIEAWVKPSSWQHSWQFRYLFVQETEADQGGRLLVTLDSGKPSFQVGDLARFSASVVPANAWTHLAFVRESGGVGKIYTNGLLAATGTVATRAVSAANLEIGNRTRSFNPFDGQMTDIRVWSTARTAVQIRRHFANRLAGDEKGLVAYWRCLDGSGTALANVCSATSGTLTGVFWDEVDELPVGDHVVLPEGTLVIVR